MQAAQFTGESRLFQLPPLSNPLAQFHDQMILESEKQALAAVCSHFLHERHGVHSGVRMIVEQEVGIGREIGL